MHEETTAAFNSRVVFKMQLAIRSSQESNGGEEGLNAEGIENDFLGF